MIPQRPNPPGERARIRWASMPGATAAAPARDLAGLRILVVDDDQDARHLVATLLQDRGAVVDCATSAAEAFESLRGSRYDVLVSDIGMPQEDGYSLLRRVRAMDCAAGGETPALALTAYASSEDRLRAIRAGFQAHLAKPAEADELAATIARLARDGRPVDAGHSS